MEGASTSSAGPSGSVPTGPSGLPLKLTFKLGVPAPSASSVATPSPPASEAMEYSLSGGDFDRDESMSEVGSTLGVAPGSDAITASTSAAAPAGAEGTPEVVVKEKPKRKRAPKRPAGEVGPGKHWRKGMKGNLAGVGLQVPIPAPPQPAPQSHSHVGGSGAPPPIPSRALAIGPAPKIATAFLPALALESRTPRPRKWNKVIKELTSVTGMPLRFRTWQGRSSSAYSDSRQELAALALAAEAANAAANPPESISPSGSPAPSATPALQFGSSPQPTPPALSVNKDPKAAAAAAAAAFRARKKDPSEKATG